MLIQDGNPCDIQPNSVKAVARTWKLPDVYEETTQSSRRVPCITGCDIVCLSLGESVS